MKCPLCKRTLFEYGSVDNLDYVCPTRVNFTDKLTTSHYEKRHQESVTWFMPPYHISFKNGKTIISKFRAANSFVSSIGAPRFDHVLTLDIELQLDSPDKIVQRINNLIILS